MNHRHSILIFKRFSSSWPKQMSLLMISVLFLIWEDARIWAREISCVSNYLKACSSSFFSRAQSTILDLHPELLSGCVGRSVAAVALSHPCRGSDGQCQFSAGRALQGHEFDRSLVGVISWSLILQCWESLLPGLAKISLIGYSRAITGLDLINSSPKSPDSLSLTSSLWFRKTSLLLFLPISRINAITIMNLIWNLYHLIRGSVTHFVILKAAL